MKLTAINHVGCEFKRELSALIVNLRIITEPVRLWKNITFFTSCITSFFTVSRVWKPNSAKKRKDTKQDNIWKYVSQKYMFWIIRLNNTSHYFFFIFFLSFLNVTVHLFVFVLYYLNVYILFGGCLLNIHHWEWVSDTQTKQSSEI